MWPKWELSSQVVGILTNKCRVKTIIEFGAGNGTDRLIDTGFSVYSIEHDPNWVRHRATATSLVPIVNRWYDHDTVDAFLRQVFDNGPVGAVIIDGPSGSIGRWGVMHHWQILNRAQVIVIDDVHRRDDAAISQAMLRVTGRGETIYEHELKKFALLEWTVSQ